MVKETPLTPGKVIDNANIISHSIILPMQVAGNEYYGDEIRLKNRFLGLRREKVKKRTGRCS